MLCSGFCTGANPNALASCQIRGSEGRGVYLVVAVGWVGQRREKRDGERLSKQLLIPSSFASSPSLLLLHFCCQKPERDQRRPTWKTSLRFSFPMPCLAALSVTDMKMLNPKSSLYLQRLPGLIQLSLSFPFASTPLLPLVSPLHHHLPPSSALASL